jgi:hypothetical protein
MAKCFWIAIEIFSGIAKKFSHQFFLTPRLVIDFFWAMTKFLFQLLDQWTMAIESW